jgi:hypothetical protein
MRSFFRGPGSRSPGADTLTRSLEQQGIKGKPTDENAEDSVDTFLRQVQVFTNIIKPKTPAWVNWVFIPLLTSGVIAAFIMSFDKKNTDKIRNTALSGGISVITAAAGFYFGRK